jgi:hypothetical protein
MVERYFEEGNEMLKRTLIVIAVALIATTVQAAGPDPTIDSAGNERGFKIDPINMSVYWPFEYKSLDLCVMPIKMKVGIIVQVNKCHQRKIELKQVDCAEISKGSGDFPCYRDCEDVEIRTNFPIKLGLSLREKSSIIKDWSAYFDGGNTLEPGTGWQKVTVCVKAWKTRLWNYNDDDAVSKIAAGSWVEVGKLAITVKPNV